MAHHQAWRGRAPHRSAPGHPPRIRPCRAQGARGGSMSDTATLSRLFSSIETDLEIVDRTFQEHATSGLDILNSAAAHVLSTQGKRIRTALTLLSGRLIDYRF